MWKHHIISITKYPLLLEAEAYKTRFINPLPNQNEDIFTNKIEIDDTNRRKKSFSWNGNGPQPLIKSHNYGVQPTTTWDRVSESQRWNSIFDPSLKDQLNNNGKLEKYSEQPFSLNGSTLKKMALQTDVFKPSQQLLVG